MALNFIYLAGPSFNRVSLSNNISATSEDTDSPVSNIGVGRPGRSFKFAASATDDLITIDMNMLSNGSFETWTLTSVPDDWTDSSDTSVPVTEETTLIVDGSSAIKLGTDEVEQASVYQDHLVAGGTVMTYIVYLRVGPTGGDATASLKIEDRSASQWLNSSGTWQDADTDAASTTSATGPETNGYTKFTDTFTVQGPADRVTCLRVIAKSIGVNGPGYADGIVLWPHLDIDFASIHGHNLDAGVTAVQLRSKATAFTASASDGTLEATMTKNMPSFFTNLGTAVSRQFWRFVFVGQNQLPIEIGEAVLGVSATLTKQIHFSTQPAFGERMPGARHTLASGETTQYNLTQYPHATISVDFNSFKSDLDEVHDSLWVASSFGANPVVIVPDHTINRAYFGKLQLTFPMTRFANNLDRWSYGIDLEESPFPAASGIIC